MRQKRNKEVEKNRDDDGGEKEEIMRHRIKNQVKSRENEGKDEEKEEHR